MIKIRGDVTLFFTSACDDSCTGVLLDDLDKLHDHFLPVNLTQAAMAPYRQLFLLENRTQRLEVRSPLTLFSSI